MATIDIQVPDIGDFDAVGVIEVLVKPGDTIAVEQSLITVESDKASMEIPSSHAGVVKELKVALGDKVKQGSIIVVLETAGAESEPKPAPAQAQQAQAAIKTEVAAPAPAPAAVAAPAAAPVAAPVAAPAQAAAAHNPSATPALFGASLGRARVREVLLPLLVYTCASVPHEQQEPAVSVRGPHMDVTGTRELDRV